MRRTRPIRFLYCLGAVSLLSSCTNLFVIELFAQNGGGATFSRPEILWLRRFDPCLKWFALYDESSGREVWRISAASGECVTVHEIRFEEPPRGFRESGPLVLLPGRSYDAAAEERGGTLGSSADRILR